MEKVFKVFDSHSEADDADSRFYALLSPDQRVVILLDLISSYASTYYGTDQNGLTEGFKRVHRIIDREEC